ncbi:MAG: GNAT family N-acetyltransferase [Anaerolineae bacterium]|nr:GNAT family N-acetyltransferase [Anaerolineae bacterium]
MNDMLVRLYDLPDMQPTITAVKAQGIDIRRGLAPEKHIVKAWIGKHFGDHWVSEADVAFARQPVSIWLAIHEGRCVGFACYDTTSKAFFGPTGVDETYRGKGIGKALLLVTLHDMFAQGYAYGIIGAPGPTEFYEKGVGAIAIPDSTPGIYRGMLHKQSE